MELGWKLPPDVARTELPVLSVVGIPIGPMRALRATRLPAPNGLAPVRHVLIRPRQPRPRCGLVPGGGEKPSDEDRHSSEIVAIEPAELGIQATVDGHDTPPEDLR